MRRCATVLIQLLLVTLVWIGSLHAQDEYGEDSKLNTNLAIAASVPLNPIARFTNFGWGTTVGAGYNFNRQNALVGEFLWNRLNPTPEVIAPIRLALNSPNVNGHANLYALTGNYRLELRGHKLGTYFIGGGGIYHRNASLSQDGPERHRHYVHIGMGMVGIQLLVRSSDEGRDDCKLSLNCIWGKWWHGLYRESGRPSLPAVHRGALPLCAQYENQHPDHTCHDGNPLLSCNMPCYYCYHN